MIRATAGATVNAVVWIMSLTKPKERQSTQQVLTFLGPFLQAKQIPFLRFEPQTAADLFAFLTSLEDQSKAGLRPIIHLDTHGDARDGLFIAASGEFVAWQEVATRLRPINVAAKNNVCLVSAACESLQIIMTLDFKAPTPFLIMLAPQHTVTFGFIETNVFNFYEDLFAFHDVLAAHERHLAPELQQFHSHRLVLKRLSGYLRDGCIGKSRRKRVRRLMSETLGPGKKHPDTPETRRTARRTFRMATAPDPGIIVRHAEPFLHGQKLSITFEDVLAFVREGAIRRNVLLRRAARTKRRNRRAQHARLKRSRALRRR
jgi:hypothetical protein